MKCLELPLTKPDSQLLLLRVAFELGASWHFSALIFMLLFGNRQSRLCEVHDRSSIFIQEDDLLWFVDILTYVDMLCKIGTCCAHSERVCGHTDLCWHVMQNGNLLCTLYTQIGCVLFTTRRARSEERTMSCKPTVKNQISRPVSVVSSPEYGHAIV